MNRKKGRYLEGRSKIKKLKRGLAWLLVTVLLSGNLSQAGAFTAFAGEGQEAESEWINQEEIPIVVSQEQVEQALSAAGTSEENQLNEWLVPFWDPETRAGVMEFLQKEMKGKVLVDQGIADEKESCMYVIFVKKGVNSENLVDQLELITLNTDPFSHCAFSLEVEGDHLNLSDGRLTEYRIREPEIISEEELYQQLAESEAAAASPSQAATSEQETGSESGSPESQPEPTVLEPSGTGADDSQPEESASETMGETVGGSTEETEGETAEETSGAAETKEKETEAQSKETEGKTQETEEKVKETEEKTKDTEEKINETEKKETEEAGTREEKDAESLEVSMSVYQVPRVAVQPATSLNAIPSDNAVSSGSGKETKTESASSGAVIKRAGEKEIPTDEELTADLFELTEPESSDAMLLLNEEAETGATGKVVKGTTAPLTLSRMSFRNHNYADGLKSAADDFYGEDASKPQDAVTSLTITRKAGDGEEIKSGELATYRISLTTGNIPQYTYNDGNKDLFDSYDHSELTLNLPEGIRLRREDNGDAIQAGGRKIPYAIEGQTCRFDLGSIPGSETVNFDIRVSVGENGVTPKGTLYEFRPEDLEFSTEIQILDRTDSDAGVPTDFIYEKTYQAEDGWTLRTVTDDRWMVRKYVVDESGSAKDPHAVLDSERGQVVVRFKVEAGMTSDGESIISDADAYGRVGRVPMTSYEIKDELTLKDLQGRPVYPDSVEVQWMAGSNAGKTVEPAAGSDVKKGLLILDQYAACEDIGADAGAVAKAAPAYTAYQVIVRYPAKPFYLEFDDKASIDDDSIFTIYNQADLKYELATADDTRLSGGNSASAQVVMKLPKKPASLKIYKYISNQVTGREDLYNTALAGMYPGAAVFEIEKKAEDGSWIPYESIKDTIKREASSGIYTDAGVIAVNPLEESRISGDSDPQLTGDDGFVQVYLQDGTYRVKEISWPQGTVKGAKAQETETAEFTVSENETKEVKFVNEPNGGSIKFTKKGKSLTNPQGAKLDGAVFGLWPETGDMKDDNCLMTAKSDRGSVLFYPVAEGKYRIKEISSAGWVLDDTVYYAAVEKGGEAGITRADGTEVPEVVNIKNEARIVIQKRITAYRETQGQLRETSVPVPNGDYGLFRQAFTVQKKVKNADGDSWVTAVPVPNSGRASLEGFGLETGSKITLNLPVLDDEGQKIEYRMVEKLPSGYYAVSGQETLEDGRVIYPIGELDLLMNEEPGTSLPNRVLNNSRYGRLQISKTLASLNAKGTGMQSAASDDYRFRLYRKQDGGYVPVSDQILGTSNGRAVFENLPVAEGTGDDLKLIQYYVEELQKEADLAPEDSWISGGAVTAEVNGGQKTLAGPFTLDTEQTVEAGVENVKNELPYWIRKIDKNSKKPLAGAEFDVYKFSDPRSADEDPTQDAGKKINQSPLTSSQGGYVYLALEPDSKYRVVETKAPENYLMYDQDGRNYQDITTGERVSPDFAIPEQDAAYTVTFENQPKAKVKIEKTMVDSTGGTSPQSVLFTVFTKDPDGQLAEAEGLSPVSSNQNFYVEPGRTYYFKEAAGDYLRPEWIPDLWLSGDPDARTESREDGLYLVWTAPDPGEIRIDNEITAASLRNYRYGSIDVVKRDARTDAGLQGASFQLFQKGADGSYQPVLDQRSVSIGGGLNGGKAKFVNVPVFDQEGNRITYQIREINPPAGYHNTDQTFETQVIPGKTITHAVSGGSWEQAAQDDSAFIFRNEPYFSITAKKIWRDDWAYSFYKVDHKLAGVEIALYELKEDAENGGAPYLSYTGRTAVTDEEGEVSFRELDRNHTYYLIETAPVDGKWLPEGLSNLPLSNGSPVSEFSMEEVKSYNYLVYNESGQSVSNDTNVTLADPLVNHKPWTQIHISKVCSTDGGATPHDPGNVSQHKVDMARFTLYRQDQKPEGNVLTAPALTIDADGRKALVDLDGLTKIDEYVTGVSLDLDGKRTPGEFDSTILDYGEIYWLVETEVPAGHLAGDNRVFAFVPGESGYTLADGTAAEIIEYGRNQVANYQAANPHDPAGGGGDAYTAQIKILKWLNQENQYSELGGAVYELYLADQEGGRIALLDTMETGLESRGDDHRGQAISDFIDLKKLYETEGFQPYITFDEAQATMTANLILVEVKAPDKVVKDDQEHKFRITVKKGEHLEDATFYWEPGDETGAEVNKDRIRLVNTVQNNYDVVITKYGYHVTEELLGKDDGQLHEALDDSRRVRMEDVTFILQRGRKTGNGYSWTKVDGMETLKTGGDGTVRVKGGLPAGTYRMQEELPKEYEGKYDAMYTGGTYRYFVVDGNEDIRVYNPDLPIIRIQKQKTDGTGVKGYRFGLYKDGVWYNGYDTGEDGWIEAAVPSGDYKIIEAPGSSQGLTNTYFQNLGDTGKGQEPLSIGYTKTNNQNSMEPAVLEKRAANNPYGQNLMDYTVTVRNPSAMTLEIHKNTGGEKPRPLAGAKFKVEWKKFETAEIQALSPGIYEREITGLEKPAATEKYNWHADGAGGSGLSYTTDADGKITIANAVPGWYRITEISAPDGYSMTFGDENHSAVIALNSDFKYSESLQAAADQAAADGWLLETGSGGKVEYEIANEPYVPIQVEKQLKLAQGVTLPKEVQDGAAENLQFKVYKKSQDGIFALLDMCRSKGDGTFEKTDSLNVTRQTDSLQGSVYTFEGYVPKLAEGESYYVKEVMNNGLDADWALTTPVEGEGYIPAGSQDGTYRAVIENTYKKAAFTIRKVDLGSPNTGVAGAEFAVYDQAPVVADGRLTVQGSRVPAVITQGEAGDYSFTVPADGQEKTYYVIETKAPDTYVGTTDYLAVTLKAGESRAYSLEGITGLTGENKTEYLNNLILTNEKGIAIELTKYSNIPSKAEDGDRMEGAAFVLYYKIGDTWNVWEEKRTDAEGRLTFANVPLNPDWQYAVRELPFDQESPYSGYRMEALHRDQTSLGTETGIQIGGGQETVNAYILENLKAGETVSYQAYNRPTASVEIKKTDLDPQAARAPKAVFTVYRILEGSGDAAVLDHTPVRTVTTQVVKGQNYTSAVLPKLEPGAYRVQETETDPAYNLIGDDARLVNYQDVTVVPGDKELEPLVFSNLQAKMGVSIHKTGPDRIGSLFASERSLKYLLEPAADNNQPLTSYTVKDGGLVMYARGGQGQPDQLDHKEYVEDKYAVTSVTVNAPDGETQPVYENHIKGGENMTASVTARVTVRRSDGTGSTYRVSGAGDGSVPYGTPITLEASERFQTVEVTYQDDALYEKTGYAVGSSFRPGTIELEMQADRQTTYLNGTDVLSRPVIQIDNQSETELKYRDWDYKGQVKEGNLTASDTCRTKVEDLDVPVVSLDKVADKANVQIGDIVTYTMTVKNETTGQQAESQYLVTDPVIVDTLPGGLAIESMELGGADGGLTMESASKYVDSDGRQVGVIQLSGGLKPQETASVILKAKVMGSALNSRDTSLVNEAYVTTRSRGIPQADNPLGATFKNTSARWAGKPDGVSYPGFAVAEKLLKADGLTTHGFVSSTAPVALGAGSSVKLMKGVRGNKNPGLWYFDETVAKVSNGADDPELGGWADYQLVVQNGVGSPDLTKLRVADLLPAVNDDNLDGKTINNATPRNSKWNLNFGGVTSVMAGDAELREDQYDVYVTTVGFREANEAARKALDQNRKPVDQGIWKKAPESLSQPSEVTAFLVDIKDDSVKLAPEEKLVISVRAQVPAFDEAEFLNNSYKFAVNDFSAQYFEKSGNTETSKPKLTSNKVQVMLEPADVEVGGRIWIDANNNGIQDDDGHGYSYYDNEYIQKMIQGTDVNLITYTGYGDSQGSRTAFEKPGSRWDGRFQWNGLSPAAPFADSAEALYRWDAALGQNDLNPKALTTNKFANHYVIETEKPEGFELAKKTAWDTQKDAGKSREPKDLIPGGQYYDTEAGDSNFRDDGNQYKSEDFFLWSTSNVFDHTKDIGLVKYRDVEILKRNQAQTALEDTEFEIYGPFEYDATAEQMKEAVSSGSMQPAVTAKTDDAGQIARDEINGKLGAGNRLLGYQKYLIVESRAAKNYQTTGATAELRLADGTKKMLETVDLGETQIGWILPFIEYDPTKVLLESIVVQDLYKTGSLEFSKVDYYDKAKLGGAVFRLTQAENSDAAYPNISGAFADYIEKLSAGQSGLSSGITDVHAATQSQARPAVEFTAEDGAVKLTGLPYGNYELTETDPPKGYFPLNDEKTYTFTIDDENPDGTLRLGGGVLEGNQIENERGDYGLKIRKRNWNNQKEISGIKFTVEGPGVYSDTWNPFARKFKAAGTGGTGTFETGADGMLAVDGLPFGTYRITEADSLAYKTAKPFYVTIDRQGSISLAHAEEVDQDKIQIKDTGEGAEIVVYNEPLTGKLTLQKVDERTRDKLSGAQFELRSDMELVEGAWNEYLNQVAGSGVSGLSRHESETGTALRFTLDQGDGYLDRLPYGAYTLTEVKPPQGYSLGDAAPWSSTFTIDSTRTEAAYVDNLFGGNHGIENEEKYTRLEKRDSANGQLLPAGAEFRIAQIQGDGSFLYVVLTGDTFKEFTGNSEEASRFATGDDGTFTLKKLPAGVYHVDELKAPSGYHINNAIPNMTIREDRSDVVTVTDTRISGSGNGGNGTSIGGGGAAGGNGRSAAGGGAATIPIEDPQVPLAGLPPQALKTDVFILDEDIPLAGIPKTGQMSAAQKLVVLFTSAIGGLFLAMGKKKKSQDS